MRIALLFLSVFSWARFADAIEPGVSLELAKERVRSLSDLRYDFELRIPSGKDSKIEGRAQIAFTLKARKPFRDVVVDFQKPELLKSSLLNEKPVTLRRSNGHLIVPAKALKAGKNTLTLEFTAGETGLKRRDDFLYTLFVPDNAAKTLPCFDQPDLKAVYRLTLRTPSEWTAVSQSIKTAERVEGDWRVTEFAETKPTSTYLFAFAAGKFQKVTRELGGREFTFYHRETDQKKVERNLDAVFELHAKSLSWLETYTDVKYPFEKFDFVALPAFPFGGMEHPGSIFYGDKLILLEETATQSQLLGRARLIAHESAHMWFGNLVTMEWFNDVWLKEVFANFMADKIISPLFPETNHSINFLFDHYPAAYSVDRTAGTNPIQQKLTNLGRASSIYGDIIYHKAPIAMRQLEALLGKDSFQAGIRKYLERYRFANATWPELLAILTESQTPVGGKKFALWNKTWIQDKAMPTLRLTRNFKGENTKLRIETLDPEKRGRVWPQAFELATIRAGITQRQSVKVDSRSHLVDLPLSDTDIVTLDARAPAYGMLELDPQSLAHILKTLPSFTDENVRAGTWLVLYENLLGRRISPAQYVELALRALPVETQDLNVDYILATLRTVYWSLLTPAERIHHAHELERVLWIETRSEKRSVTARTSFYRAYQALFTSDEAWNNVEAVWRKALALPGLTFAEVDDMGMAYSLALRKPSARDGVAAEQLARLKDDERKNEFSFVMNAIKGSSDDREKFFRVLLTDEGRKNEPWVREALGYLHHPLHGNESEGYLARSLEILPRLKATGGIFFPTHWLLTTLRPHVSLRARTEVEAYLRKNPKLEEGLKLKLLQAADLTFRFTK